MRKLVVLLALVVVAAGCGGGSSSSTKGQSHSVLQVSKAFFDAGIPFTSMITGNQYVTGQVPFLPGSLNKSNFRFDVAAQLSGSNTNTHTGWDVWVFDTDAHANAALKQVPLSGWGEGNGIQLDRKQLANVVVVAAGFTGANKAALDKALSEI